MNITTAATLLLSYFSEEEREMPDNTEFLGRNAAVASALNHALQEMYGDGKPWMRNEKRSIRIAAPTHIEITVTEDSDQATITSPPAWFLLSVLKITGESNDNRITAITGNTVTLELPYDGSTGTVAATVYQDRHIPADDVMGIYSPVLYDGANIQPMNNPAGNGLTRSLEDYGFHRTRNVTPQSKAITDSIGTPVYYSVETFIPTALANPQVYIALSPAPDAKGIFSYQAKLTPPLITDLQSEENIPCPFGYIDSIFLPIAVKKLRGSPFWRKTDGEDEIEASFLAAMTAIAKLAPQKNPGLTILFKY
jgi:hypothetical protein